MSLFKCDVCKEKDARINDLQSQISRLEKLVFPPRPTQDISVADYEHTAEETLPPVEDPIAKEAHDLLTGGYDYDHEYQEI